MRCVGHVNLAALRTWAATRFSWREGLWPRLREEQGVAMVEFALIATVLFVLIAGGLYLGRFINYQTDETHLANVAARYAAVVSEPSSCAGQALAACVKGQAYGELASGSNEVTAVQVCVANGTGGSGNVGDPVTATVTSYYSFLPILGIGQIKDVESATMRLEAPISTATFPVLGCSG